MKLFKYCCAIMALPYLVTAFLPMHFNVAHHNGAGTIGSEWGARAVAIADVLLLGAMFYGLHRRNPIYWILIPILMVAYLLSVVIPPLWTIVSLSLPWVPFMFIVFLFAVGALGFCAWWRHQRSYFAW
jgi:hypothetical protein